MLGIYTSISLFVFMAWCVINPLNAKLNPTCNLLALLVTHHILHVSGLRVKHRDKLMFYVQLYSIYNGECKVWGFYGRQVAYDAVYNCCPSPIR
jgi:hypothetical protein